MKAFYVFSIFVVFITIDYVYGGSNADSDSEASTGSNEPSKLFEHNCDPLAINTYKNDQREGADAMNQVFPIRAFLQDNETNYHVARASPPVRTKPKSTDDSEGADDAESEEESDEIDETPTSKFCHVPFFDRDCGPLHYHQKFAEAYDPTKLVNGLKGIRLNATFVGMNLDNGKAIQYNMVIEGTNEDDYIFQWVKNTPITAYEIDDNGDKKEIETIPEEVLNRLKSEFAINRIGLSEPEKENKPAEEIVGLGEYDDDEEDEQVEHSEESVKKSDDETHDKEAKQVEKKAEDPEEEDFTNRDRLFMIFVSCDGRSMWASYNKSIVRINDEASDAVDLDRYVQDLQASVTVLRKVDLLVKPVSTYMPKRFDQLIPFTKTISVP